MDACGSDMDACGSDTCTEAAKCGCRDNVCPWDNCTCVSFSVCLGIV
jgi:hypothetical protein